MRKPRNISEAVDRLGDVRAALGPLKEEDKMLAAYIKENAVHSHERGRRYACTIAHRIRKLLDMDAVREKLTPQFMRAHTREVEQVALSVTAIQPDREVA